MTITKVKLMEMIRTELTSLFTEMNPNLTLAQHTEKDFEEREEDPDALRADTVLGLGPEEIAALPSPPQRPPKEYRRQAIQMLAGLMDPDHIKPHDIDVVAWQLFNQAMQGDTVAVEEPPKKKKRFRLNFFENTDKRRNAELLNLLRTILKTAEDPYTDEQHLLSLGDDLQDMLAQLNPSAQWAQEKGYNQPTYSEEVGRYIREELEVYMNEVYSDKQRSYMCAMKDAPDGEKPESLSQGEAEELCTGPMKKPKTKRGNKK
jgi:hypothetical protein